MNCPNCNTKNPDNANFCFNCAYDLKQIQKRDTAPQLDKYIPKALLDKIQHTDNVGGIQNERRIVTILFCDIVGSSSHAETLDPEEWTEIVNGAFDFIIPPVYKYEGIIARLMGDAILAFFGAPISHEDDPERSVLAALDMLSAMKGYSDKVKSKWGFEINVRVGINTGLVVVGEMGTDLRVEYTAMGDAINVASRMESTAKPGTIQITQNTFKLISYMFEAKALGKVDVKGKAEPINTFEILQKKGIGDRQSKSSHMNTSFVEREKELNMLLLQADNMENGNSQICWISGEAGIGKSRLIAELYYTLKLEERVHDLTKKFDPKSDKMYWFETGALPYQVSTPYAPIINFMQKFFGITIDMSNDDKFNCIKEGLKYQPHGEEVFPFIASLLQIQLTNHEMAILSPLNPVAFQEEVIRNIILFLKDFTSVSPLILVIDDIQWADASTQLLIDQVLDFLHENKVMLIILSREKPDETSKIWKKIETKFTTHYTQLELDHLSNFGASSLISNLLKVENLSDEVRNLIITRSQGNPFYTEELVKSFIDSGYIVNEAGSWILKKELSELTIPDTLNNLLMTRLDQLEEKTRRVAQTASVIGREFMIPILECLNTHAEFLDDSLSELEQRQWIVEKYMGGDRGYLFKHVLSRDVAYNSLLFKRRKELHRKVAECLQRTDKNLIDEIGRHLFEADSYEEAIPYIIKAAEAAIRSNSIMEAISLLNKAENVQDKVSDFDNIVAMYLNLGTAHAMSGKVEDSAKYFETLLKVSKEKDYKEGEVKALNKLAENAVYGRGDLEQADKYLSEAEELGNLINFSEGLLETSVLRCTIHQGLGQFDKSAEYEEKGYEVSRKLNNDFFAQTFKYNLIISYSLSFKIEEAETLIQDFEDTYSSKGELYYTSSIYAYVIPSLRFIQGKFDEAIELIKKGFEMASNINARYPLYLAHRSLGEIYQTLQDDENALMNFEESMKYTSKASNFGFLATSKICIALFKLKLGEDDPELIKDALELIEMPNGRYWASRTYGDLGHYYLEKKNYQVSLKYFELALNEVTASYYIFKPYNLTGKIRAYIELGELDHANQTLNDLNEYCETNQFRSYDVERHFLQGVLSLKHTDIEAATKSFDEARKIAEQKNMKFWLEKINKVNV